MASAPPSLRLKGLVKRFGGLLPFVNVEETGEHLVHPCHALKHLAVEGLSLKIKSIEKAAGHPSAQLLF